MKLKKKHEVSPQRSWMISALERLQSQSPEQPFFVEYAEIPIVRTRRRFYALAQGFARFLSQHGVGRETRIIVDIDMKMRWEIFVAWCACQMLSASVFFWPPDMRYRHARKEAVQADELNGSPTIVITGSPVRAKRWLEDDAERGIEHRMILFLTPDDVEKPEVTFKGKTPDNLISFHRAIELNESENSLTAAPATDEAALVYTQGSHQEARLVSLSYAHLHDQAEDLQTVLKLDETSRIFIDLVCPHTVCLVLFACCLQSGATFVCRSQNHGIEDILCSSGITHAFLLPKSLAILGEQLQNPESSGPMAKKWRNLCLKFGKYRARNPESSHRWFSSVIDAICLEPTRREIFPQIKALVSYGNHFDSKMGELFSFLGVNVMNAYTLSELGFVHLHAFMGEGSYLKSIEYRIKNGVLSVKSNRNRMPYICTDDLVLEDSRCGLCTRRNRHIQLNTGACVDVSPMREILCREPLIDEVFIFGQDRPYLTALIYLNRDALFRWAKEQNLPLDSFEVLSQNLKVYQHVRSIVDACNLRRTSLESIQKIAILTRTIDEDPRILTPCGLTRRTDVEHRYLLTINSFYSDNF